MDFRGATDRLTSCCTLSDVAEAIGASYAAVKQARMESDNPAFRTPPPDWRQKLARLARERARELEDLAEGLEGR